MPITNLALHVNNRATQSTNDLSVNSVKNKGNLLKNFFSRIFNSPVKLTKIGDIIDKPVNNEQLSKELNISANISSVRSLAEIDRNIINTWIGTSEIYTNNIPSNISPYVDTDTKELLSALHKMPKHNGILYRVGEAPGFISGKIKAGDTVITKRLLSFSSSLEFVKGFAPGRKVYFVLDASTSAHDISKFNPEAAESVVDINSIFDVNHIITTPKGNMVIHLKENTSQLGYKDAKDLYTGESFLVKK